LVPDLDTIAHDPEPESRLPCLLWVPLGDELLFSHE
jgi:hypothetical protein